MNLKSAIDIEKIKQKLKPVNLNIGIMALAGVLSIGIGQSGHHSWPWDNPDEGKAAAAVPIAAEKEFLKATAAEAAEGSDALQESSVYVPVIHPDARPTPARLNMAFYYPEGTTEPSKSYAGRAFSDLNRKDVYWISQIYSYSKTSPADMAVRLGRSLPGAPEQWNRINVTFYNGDGTPISGYSNAREILSMASVYAYFNGIKSREEFYAYAEKLWNASHSYSVSMSDLYYCDGSCLLASDNEEHEAEDLPPDLSSLDDEEDDIDYSVGPGIFLQESEPETSSETTETSQAETETTPEWIRKGPGAAPTEGSGSDGTQSGDAGSDGAQSGAAAAGTAAQTVTETAAATAPQTVPETTVPETTPQTVPETVSETAAQTAPETLPETAAALPETTEAPAGETAPAIETTTEFGPGMELPPTASEIGSSEGDSAAGQESPQADAAAPETTTPANNIAATPENIAAGPGAVPASSSAESAASEENKDHGPCPGHVDLNIRATIIGLNAGKNLFSIDSTGNAQNNFSGNWYGWSDSRRAYAEDINSQDWYAEYGLTISTSMYIRNPLTGSEIQHYMSLVPANTSDTRKALVRQALQTVGSIPYYWGGKPSGPGFEVNGFGTVVAPDTKGRMLRGLDCSGWIAWVYWTALGRVLPYQSTSGLSTLGTGISRSQLRPGDIIVRTGPDAHVYMFLAWADGDSMYLIHETGGITNNVTIGIYNVDWPYNRDLIGD